MKRLVCKVKGHVWGLTITTQNYGDPSSKKRRRICSRCSHEEEA
jgi:hypothetical protein